MELDAQTIAAELRTPFAASHGTVTDRELILVTLRAADGVAGHGEAAPLPSYDGIGTADVLAALDVCRPVLAAYPAHAPVADVLARCAEVTVISHALAAIDMALWDLAGRRAREPVWRLLGATSAPPVAVNRTIAAADRSSAALEAAQARAAGFTTVKVKVGIGDDAARLAAVRAFAGPQMAIRIDANGAWSADEAAVALRALAPVEIELCEEPVHGAAAFAALHGRTEIPLALDESAGDPQIIGAPGVADLVCLKIARCGGISGVLQDAVRARAAGYAIYLASTLDGPLGIAAALHAAAAIGADRACGLATLELFADRPNPLPARDGTLALPGGVGLGEHLVRWYDAA